MISTALAFSASFRAFRSASSAALTDSFLPSSITLSGIGPRFLPAQPSSLPSNPRSSWGPLSMSMVRQKLMSRQESTSLPSTRAPDSHQPAAASLLIRWRARPSQLPCSPPWSRSEPEARLRFSCAGPFESFHLFCPLVLFPNPFHLFILYPGTRGTVNPFLKIFWDFFLAV